MDITTPAPESSKTCSVSAQPVPYLSATTIATMTTADIGALRSRAVLALAAAGLLDTAYMLHDLHEALVWRAALDAKYPTTPALAPSPAEQIAEVRREIDAAWAVMFPDEVTA